MKLKPENRLALLEAFARSKGYEFRGFTAIWLVGHPEAAEPEPIVVVESIPEVAVPTVEAPVEEKPKRRRRKEVTTDV